MYFYCFYFYIFNLFINLFIFKVDGEIKNIIFKLLNNDNNNNHSNNHYDNSNNESSQLHHQLNIIKDDSSSFIFTKPPSPTICCTSDSTLSISNDGNVFSFGHSDYGHHGHEENRPRLSSQF